ncbi:fibronectin type 3 and ankyrin repeat domains protein 1 [Bubalus kerabau]|uniref:fibronectin type 3 and ankyrin repeat domains protein 1 n=1 Tax=Bubalus carabanensis TaxID=3119969 RepID=UPI00244EE137|nr:fibronectin type 3 and ankyrin repeat domains protein 1 [Bubalus carabanensis]
MPGVPETLSGGVNEKGDRGWAREETPGVLGAAPLPGEKPLGPHKPWQGHFARSGATAATDSLVRLLKTPTQEARVRETGVEGTRGAGVDAWFVLCAQEFSPRGYATKHVVEGLEPRTLYRFRLKVTSPSGEYAYSPVVSGDLSRETGRKWAPELRAALDRFSTGTGDQGPLQAGRKREASAAFSSTRSHCTKGLSCPVAPLLFLRTFPGLSPTWQACPHCEAFSPCPTSLGEPISSEHLHRAVNVNDEDLLVRILQGGNVKVDVPNKFGFTALMVAAQRGYTRLVKILISHGTDVNLQNGSGKDSLMLACYAGHLDVVKYLRRHGASWDTRDLGGCTALHWAADGGHCNVIEWMIGDGCEVDAVDAGSRWTPLMRVSAVSGNQEVASLLIDAGADVNMKDKDGKTPLMVAVLNNHEELVQLLLDRGADASVKNEFGKGVLEMARVFDRQNVLSLLEERKRKQMLKKSSVR